MDIPLDAKDIQQNAGAKERHPRPVPTCFLAADAEQGDAKRDESEQEENPVVRIKR